jgi:light-regulated signal transduction histidine kinase (bacteriophytochrome)
MPMFLLTSLIFSTVKVTSIRPRGKIEIVCSKKEGEDICLVKNNSVGFNIGYADRFSGVFQLPHGQDEFEDSEIVLLSVLCMIVLQGGGTWAQEFIGRESTCYCNLQMQRVA